MSNSLRPHGLQHTSLLCLSTSSRVCSNSWPLSWWCHPAISSCVVPLFSCPQSFPASGSFPMSQLFTSGAQSIRASASVLPMNKTIKIEKSLLMAVISGLQYESEQRQCHISQWKLSCCLISYPTLVSFLKTNSNRCWRKWRKENPLALSLGM